MISPDFYSKDGYDIFDFCSEIRTRPVVSAGYARPDCAAGRRDRFGAAVAALCRQKSPIGFSVVRLSAEELCDALVDCWAGTMKLPLQGDGG